MKKKIENIFLKKKILIYGLGKSGISSFRFLRNKADIYINNVTYIPCKPDFSDLEEIILKVLDNYDSYKKMLVNNRKMLDSLDMRKKCQDFWKKIIKIYKKHKN